MIIRSECELHIGVPSVDIVATLQKQADLFGSKIAFVCNNFSILCLFDKHQNSTWKISLFATVFFVERSWWSFCMCEHLISDWYRFWLWVHVPRCVCINAQDWPVFVLWPWPEKRGCYLTDEPQLCRVPVGNAWLASYWSSCLYSQPVVHNQWVVGCLLYQYGLFVKLHVHVGFFPSFLNLICTYVFDSSIVKTKLFW